jgi:type I restriction enzyme, S subunit
MHQSNVPQLRFPNSNNDWSSQSFEDIFEFKNGYNPPVEHYGSGIKYINVLDIINNNYLTYNLIAGFSIADTAIQDKFSVKYGDILFQRSSETREEVGQSNVYLDERMNAIFGGFVIRGRTKIKIDSIFINYALKNQFMRKAITRMSGGSTRYNIGQDSLNKIYMLYPTIVEQTKIASFLTAVGSKIEKLTRKKELLEEYKKGVMQKLFSGEIRFRDENGNDYPDWEEKKMGEIIDSLSDYTANGSFASLKENVQYYNEKNYAALVRTTDLEKSKFNPQRFTDKKGYDFLKKTSLFGGEIILANVGSIGKVYKAPVFNYPMTLAPNTYVLRFNKGISEDFIFQLMTIYDFKCKLLRMVGSSTLSAINKSSLRSIKIKIPSLNEQRKIALFLDAIDSKIENTSSKIEKTKEFKKGLLQQMFV